MPLNPPWEEEELILVLELYQRVGVVDSKHPAVMEVSQLLRSLPLHPSRADPARFRNPNNVASKLANFGWLDPTYGSGLPNGGRRTREIWKRFRNNTDLLAQEAGRLREWAHAIRSISNATVHDNAATSGQESTILRPLSRPELISARKSDQLQRDEDSIQLTLDAVRALLHLLEERVHRSR